MFLVVDQAMVRAGVHRLLERRGRFRVVGAAEDPIEALPAILESLAELVVCAFYREASPGVSRLSPLKAALPACRVLLLDEHGDPGSRAALDEGGVDAVLPTRADPDELLLALDSIHRGYPYLSPALAGRPGPGGGPESESAHR
jgi:two-component system response regulator DesR